MDIRTFKEEVFKKELKALVEAKQKELGDKVSTIEIARAISVDKGIPDYMSLYRVIYGSKLNA